MKNVLRMLIFGVPVYVVSGIMMKIIIEDYIGHNTCGFIAYIVSCVVFVLLTIPILVD